MYVAGGGVPTSCDPEGSCALRRAGATSLAGCDCTHPASALGCATAAREANWEVSSLPQQVILDLGAVYSVRTSQLEQPPSDEPTGVSPPLIRYSLKCYGDTVGWHEAMEGASVVMGNASSPVRCAARYWRLELLSSGEDTDTPPFPHMSHPVSPICQK